jgi:hypothetical protein
MMLTKQDKIVHVLARVSYEAEQALNAEIDGRREGVGDKDRQIDRVLSYFNDGSPPVLGESVEDQMRGRLFKSIMEAFR